MTNMESRFISKIFGPPLLDSRRVLPERRDLDDLPVGKVNVGDAKSPADDEATTEYLLEPGRLGIGGDIVVLRFLAQVQVAHGTAHKVGREAQLVQTLKDMESRWRHVLARYRVLRSGDLSWQSGRGR